MKTRSHFGSSLAANCKNCFDFLFKTVLSPKKRDVSPSKKGGTSCEIASLKNITSVKYCVPTTGQIRRNRLKYRPGRESQLRQLKMACGNG